MNQYKKNNAFSSIGLNMFKRFLFLIVFFCLNFIILVSVANAEGIVSYVPSGAEGEIDGAIFTTSSNGEAIIITINNEGVAIGDSITFNPGSTWTPLKLYSVDDGSYRLTFKNSSGTISFWKLDSDFKFLGNYTLDPPASNYTLSTYFPTSGGGKVVWKGSTGNVRIWTLSSSGTKSEEKSYGPYSGWTPIEYSLNDDGTAQLFWRHTTGTVTLWKISANNTYEGNVNLPPPTSGHILLSYRSILSGGGKVVWKGSTGNVRIWTLSSSGTKSEEKSYGPYSGWTPIEYSLNDDGTAQLFWRHTTGTVTLWKISANNTYEGNVNLPPESGYSFYGHYPHLDGTSRVLWKNDWGLVVWTMSASGTITYRSEITISTPGEADLGGGILGPEITIGLNEYTTTEIRDNSFRIEDAINSETGASVDYAIKDGDGKLIAIVSAGEETRVKLESGHQFRIYRSLPSDEYAFEEVRFEAANPEDVNTIVFDTNLPIAYNDRYRGKMKLLYYDSSVADGDRVWAINTLPLEQYTWGMGEITGTGDMDYNRVMTTSYRTYGYWKIKFSTQYAAQGFKVNATPGNQLYYGFNWEQNHSRIRSAAEDTRGKIVMYSGEIAITPYSSWTDGRTRSFEERWGSILYPWCQSVSDPYGKHPTKSTAELEAEGNHMVGLSAHGALSLAGDHGWDWDDIINYYFTGVTLVQAY